MKQITLNLNEDQIRLIVGGLERSVSAVWDDPECFGFEKSFTEVDSEEEEYNEDEIQKYIDENIYTIIKQLNNG